MFKNVAYSEKVHMKKNLLLAYSISYLTWNMDKLNVYVQVIKNLKNKRNSYLRKVNYDILQELIWCIKHIESALSNKKSNINMDKVYGRYDKNNFLLILCTLLNCKLISQNIGQDQINNIDYRQLKLDTYDPKYASDFNGRKIKKFLNHYMELWGYHNSVTLKAAEPFVDEYYEIDPEYLDGNYVWDITVNLHLPSDVIHEDSVVISTLCEDVVEYDQRAYDINFSFLDSNNNLRLLFETNDKFNLDSVEKFIEIMKYVKNLKEGEKNV